MKFLTYVLVSFTLIFGSNALADDVLDSQSQLSEASAATTAADQVINDAATNDVDSDVDSDDDSDVDKAADTDHVTINASAASQTTGVPTVTVKKLSGGEQQITVMTKRTDGTTRDVVVIIDRQGNKETKIITTDPDGKKTTSVVADNAQVQVKDTPDVTIGVDGTLVDQTKAKVAENDATDS